MAIVYDDIITSETLVQDEQYKLNLYKQIEEMLEFDPSAYDIHEIEFLVDIAMEASDIIEEFEETGTFDDSGDVVFNPEYLWLEIDDYTRYSKEQILQLNFLEKCAKDILVN